jgi:hypothetical protein
LGAAGRFERRRTYVDGAVLLAKSRADLRRLVFVLVCVLNAKESLV